MPRQRRSWADGSEPSAGISLESKDGVVTVQDRMAATPKQQRFWRLCDTDGIDQVLFHGSVRGGKSQACCKKIAEWAWRYPKTTWGVFRATYKELEDSTKKIMVSGDSNMPPALPPELVERTYNAQDINKTVLRNGSEILYRSLEPDNRGKIRNITFAGVFIDQIEELDDEERDPKFYVELQGRCSHPGAPQKVLSAANPESESHWLVPWFGLTEETRHLAMPGTAQVHVSIFDNAANLDKVYVDRLLSTELTAPDYFERMVLGQWGSFGGKRFKKYNRRRTVLPAIPEGFKVESWWEVIEGHDYGWAHPYGVVWVILDDVGQWWVVAEWNETEQGIADVVKAVNEIRRNEGGMLGFHGRLDPSLIPLSHDAWASRGEYGSPAHELLEQGIMVTPANTERLGGWARLEGLLTEVMPDGYTRLRILPSVTLLPRQISGAKIKEGTDDIEKRFDDVLDALRYVVMTRMPVPVQPGDEDDDDDPPMDRQSAYQRMLRHKRDPKSAAAGVGSPF